VVLNARKSPSMCEVLTRSSRGMLFPRAVFWLCWYSFFLYYSVQVFIVFSLGIVSTRGVSHATPCIEQRAPSCSCVTTAAVCQLVDVRSTFWHFLVAFPRGRMLSVDPFRVSSGIAIRLFDAKLDFLLDTRGKT